MKRSETRRRSGGSAVTQRLGLRAGDASTNTVNPHFHMRARAIEDRLIKLIDGGENLADWYHRPNMGSVMRGPMDRPLLIAN